MVNGWMTKKEILAQFLSRIPQQDDFRPSSQRAMPSVLTMPLRTSYSRRLHRLPTSLPHRCCFTTSPLHPTPSLVAVATAIKSHPAKLIPDYLTPTNSHLLATTLSDLLPPAYAAPSTPLVVGAPAALPPGHHLVYFPIQLPPSRLVPDGADPDHAPGAPFHRRMWAGGEVVFRPAARRRLRLDGRPWLCHEAVEAVDVRGMEGQEKVFVDVRRKYGLGHEGYQDVGRLDAQEWLIEERRTLVFMRNGDSGSPPPPPPRLIKSKTSLLPSHVQTHLTRVDQAPTRQTSASPSLRRPSTSSTSPR